MKNIFIWLLLLLAFVVPTAAQQYTFTGLSNGTLVTPPTRLDSLSNVSGLGDATGSTFQVQSERAEAFLNGGATPGFASVAQGRTWNVLGDTIVISATWTTIGSAGASLQIGVFSDTTINGTGKTGWLFHWSTNGIMGRYRIYNNATSVVIENSQTGTFRAPVAGDVLSFVSIGDSMFLYVNSERAVGAWNTNDTRGKVAQMYPVWRLNRVNGTSPQIDNLTISRTGFLTPSAPPPTTDTQVPTGSLAFTPPTWTVGTTGNVIVSVQDGFAIKDMVVSFDSGAGYQGLDSLKNYNTSVPGAKTASWSTRNISFGASKTVNFRLLGRDSSNNVGYIATAQLNVSSAANAPASMPIFAWLPKQNISTALPERLPWQYMTHLVLFGENFKLDTDPTPYLDTAKAWADWSTGMNTGYGNGATQERNTDGTLKTNWQVYTEKRAQFGVKLMVSVLALSGNGGATQVNTWISDTIKAKAAAAKIGHFIKDRGFNGVDFNMESLSNIAANRTGYDVFIRVLRDTMNTMNPVGIITQTSAAWAFYGGNVNTPHILKQTFDRLDYYQLELYNMAGVMPWLADNCPLYGNTSTQPWLTTNGSSNPTYVSYQIPIQWTRNASYSVDKRKLVFLMALGETNWTTYTTTTTYPLPTLGAPIASGGWRFDRFELAYNLMNQYPTQVGWNPIGLVPHIYAPINPGAGQTGRWYTFENAASISYKVKYAIDSGFGGVGNWELGRGMLGASGNWASPQQQWLYEAVIAQGVINTPAPAVPALSSPSNGATTPGTATTLSWGSVSYATYYYLEVRDGGNNIVTLPGSSNITSTSYAIPSGSLVPGASYTWRVGAGNGTGLSGYSANRSFTVQSLTPVQRPTPTLLTPANASNNVATSITLTWSSVDTITGYEVTYNYPDTTTNTPTVVSIPSSDTTLALVGLPNDVNVFWKVKAVNSGGTSSSYSSYFMFRTIAVSNPVNPGTSAEYRPQTLKLLKDGVTYREINTPVGFLTLLDLPDTSRLANTYTPGLYNFAVIGVDVWKRGNTGNAIRVGTLSNFSGVLNQVLTVNDNTFLNGNLNVTGTSNFQGTINVAQGITVGSGASVSMSPSNLVMSTRAPVPGFTADSATHAQTVGGLTAAQIIDSARNTDPYRIVEYNEWFTNGDAGISRTTAFSTQKGAGWVVKGFNTPETGTATVGTYRPIFTVADSTEFGVFQLAPDTGIHYTSPTLAAGLWVGNFSNSSGVMSTSALPPLNIGNYFKVKITGGASMDSCIWMGGIINMSVNTGIAANEVNRAGIYWQAGNPTGSADSLYGITCDGTTKTTVGLVPVTNATWYEIEFKRTSSGIEWYVNGVLRKTITTNFPSTSTGGMYFMGTWNYDSQASGTKTLQIARTDIRDYNP